MEGRASIYRDAYSIYYQKGKPGYRSAADWYNTLYPLFAAGKLTESELKAEIDRIVTAHCDEFWAAETRMAWMLMWMRRGRKWRGPAAKPV